VKSRLKVLRAERNWSQQDLAEKLGVSRQTVNAIETEKYDPSLPLALKIARLFTRPVESIFTLDDFSSSEVDEPIALAAHEKSG
jgi:putative transcriptional regulator